MTNYEKIKQMSIEEMIEVLVPEDGFKNVADEKYCTEVCPFRKNGKCPFDDDYVPCGGLSYEYMTIAWLMAEAKDNG